MEWVGQDLVRQDKECKNNVLGKWESKLQQEVFLATSDPHDMDRNQTRTETKKQETREAMFIQVTLACVHVTTVAVEEQ